MEERGTCGDEWSFGSDSASDSFELVCESPDPELSSYYANNNVLPPDSGTPDFDTPVSDGMADFFLREADTMSSTEAFLQFAKRQGINLSSPHTQRSEDLAELCAMSVDPVEPLAAASRSFQSVDTVKTPTAASSSTGAVDPVKPATMALPNSASNSTEAIALLKPGFLASGNTLNRLIADGWQLEVGEYTGNDTDGGTLELIQPACKSMDKGTSMVYHFPHFSPSDSLAGGDMDYFADLPQEAPRQNQKATAEDKGKAKEAGYEQQEQAGGYHGMETQDTGCNAQNGTGQTGVQQSSQPGFESQTGCQESQPGFESQTGCQESQTGLESQTGRFRIPYEGLLDPEWQWHDPLGSIAQYRRHMGGTGDMNHSRVLADESDSVRSEQQACQDDQKEDSRCISGESKLMTYGSPLQSAKIGSGDPYAYILDFSREYIEVMEERLRPRYGVHPYPPPTPALEPPSEHPPHEDYCDSYCDSSCTYPIAEADCNFSDPFADLDPLFGINHTGCAATLPPSDQQHLEKDGTGRDGGPIMGADESTGRAGNAACPTAAETAYFSPYLPEGTVDEANEELFQVHVPYRNWPLPLEGSAGRQEDPADRDGSVERGVEWMRAAGWQYGTGSHGSVVQEGAGMERNEAACLGRLYCPTGVSPLRELGVDEATPVLMDYEMCVIPEQMLPSSDGMVSGGLGYGDGGFVPEQQDVNVNGVRQMAAVRSWLDGPEGMPRGRNEKRGAENGPGGSCLVGAEMEDGIRVQGVVGADTEDGSRVQGTVGAEMEDGSRVQGTVGAKTEDGTRVQGPIIQQMDDDDDLDECRGRFMSELEHYIDLLENATRDVAGLRVEAGEGTAGREEGLLGGQTGDEVIRAVDYVMRADDGVFQPHSGVIPGAMGSNDDVIRANDDVMGAKDDVIRAADNDDEERAEYMSTEMYARNLKEAGNLPTPQPEWRKVYITLVVAGPSSSGKSTLMHNLMSLCKNTVSKIWRNTFSTCSLKAVQRNPYAFNTAVEMTDFQNQIHYTFRMQETPTTEDPESVPEIEKFIQDQNKKYYQTEMLPTRALPIEALRDPRVDAVLYCLPPHRATKTDLDSMQRLSLHTTVIPIFAKSDCMTEEEICLYREELEATEQYKETMDNSFWPVFSQEKLTDLDLGAPPFAVIASLVSEETFPGCFNPVRHYLWGSCLPMKHSKLAALKKLLFDKGANDLKAKKEARYLAFRERKMRSEIDNKRTLWEEVGDVMCGVQDVVCTTVGATWRSTEAIGKDIWSRPFWYLTLLIALLTLMVSCVATVMAPWKGAHDVAPASEYSGRVPDSSFREGIMRMPDDLFGSDTMEFLTPDVGFDRSKHSSEELQDLMQGQGVMGEAAGWRQWGEIMEKMMEKIQKMEDVNVQILEQLPKITGSDEHNGCQVHEVSVMAGEENAAGAAECNVSASYTAGLEVQLTTLTNRLHTVETQAMKWEMENAALKRECKEQTSKLEKENRKLRSHAEQSSSEAGHTSKSRCKKQHKHKVVKQHSQAAAACDQTITDLTTAKDEAKRQAKEARHLVKRLKEEVKHCGAERSSHDASYQAEIAALQQQMAQMQQERENLLQTVEKLREDKREMKVVHDRETATLWGMIEARDEEIMAVSTGHAVLVDHLWETTGDGEEWRY